MSNTITGMMHATETITAESWKGIKGDKGEKGATGYSPTATVTQTDTGATVTITDAKGTTTADIANGSDASVTKDNIVAALGYTPESGTWELINTATVSEEVNSVMFFVDSGGNAFKLSKVLVLFDFPSAISGTKDVVVGESTHAFYRSISAKSGHCYASVTIDGWVIGTGGFTSAAPLGSATNRDIASAGPVQLPNGYMDRACIMVSGDPIPAGSTITVYGVRI